MNDGCLSVAEPHQRPANAIDRQSCGAFALKFDDWRRYKYNVVLVLNCSTLQQELPAPTAIARFAVLLVTVPVGLIRRASNVN